MKISYYSLGCKVNLYECESIINTFLDNGFTLEDFNKVCDVYLINTCSITEVSDAKSRKIIRQAKKNNPDGIVAVMGCYAQLKPQDIKQIDGVDVLIGTSNRDKMYELIMEAIENKQSICCVDDILNVIEYEELKLNKFSDKTRGFIKIEDGCDNYCSYCTIPYARGHVRSRKKENIISEIQSLCDNGVKEIVLSGINTGHYGHDFSDYDFADLLYDICANVHNLGMLRISSIEMTEITEELLNVMKENSSHFCEHLHVPLQGGCDNTLKRMHRKYNTSEFRDKLALIRSFFPSINITTDCLAGFCGETDDDFMSSIEFIKSLNFGEMHIFPYSRRPRTVAYHYPDQVSPLIKKQRVNALLEINKIKALEYRNNYKDKVVSVLVERVKNGLYFGHTSNYIEVEFTGDSKINEYVNVLLKEIEYPICKGVKVE